MGSELLVSKVDTGAERLWHKEASIRSMDPEERSEFIIALTSLSGISRF